MKVERILGTHKVEEDPVELYFQWEYIFLRYGLVKSPEEFAEMPIPVALDLMKQLKKEIEGTKRR